MKKAKIKKGKEKEKEKEPEKDKTRGEEPSDPISDAEMEIDNDNEREAVDSEEEDFVPFPEEDDDDEGMQFIMEKNDKALVRLPASKQEMWKEDWKDVPQRMVRKMRITYPDHKNVWQKGTTIEHINSQLAAVEPARGAKNIIWATAYGKWWSNDKGTVLNYFFDGYLGKKKYKVVRQEKGEWNMVIVNKADEVSTKLVQELAMLQVKLHAYKGILLFFRKMRMAPTGWMLFQTTRVVGDAEWEKQKKGMLKLEYMKDGKEIKVIEAIKDIVIQKDFHRQFSVEWTTEAKTEGCVQWLEDTKVNLKGYIPLGFRKAHYCRECHSHGHEDRECPWDDADMSKLLNVDAIGAARKLRPTFGNKWPANSKASTSKDAHIPSADA